MTALDGNARLVELVPDPALEAEPFVLSVSTAREVCELPDPPQTAEVIGPLVARGERTVLGGYTGEGKTTLTTQIAAAVKKGRRVPRLPSAARPRAHYRRRAGHADDQARLREAGLDNTERVDFIRVPDGLDLDNDQEQSTPWSSSSQRGTTPSSSPTRSTSCTGATATPSAKPLT